MEDFYPMPMFVNLEVSDLQTSVAWYQQALGFRVVFQHPADTPTMVHLRRDRYQDLLLYPAASDAAARPAANIIIQFQAGDSSVREIAAQAAAAGDEATVDGPVKRPWNARDVTVRDPDGNRLRFSEPIDVTREFEDVVGQV